MLEERIIKDDNGFYNVQVRILPVEDWQQNDGWGTVYITGIYEHAVEKLSRKDK